jgi:mono/diheme cytochrome c family protein
LNASHELKGVVMKKLISIGIGFLLLTLSAPSQAEEQEDLSAAQASYHRYCASCHGVEGKGNGPVANALKSPPADLTRLSKNNNGTFPRQRVYDTIDGRYEVRAHGPRDMPVWGEQFKASHVGTEGYARSNMMMLTRYLESIQAK